MKRRYEVSLTRRYVLTQVEFGVVEVDALDEEEARVLAVSRADVEWEDHETLPGEVDPGVFADSVLCLDDGDE